MHYTEMIPTSVHTEKGEPMSDLISRSEVWKAFISRVDSICDLGDVREILDSIPTAEPTIDLVRCGECKWYDKDFKDCNIRDSYGWEYKPTDFCSYGERRVDEN